MAKVRVTLYREYELNYTEEELRSILDEDHGIAHIERIDDMEELEIIDDLAGAITTGIVIGSIRVEDEL